MDGTAKIALRKLHDRFSRWLMVEETKIRKGYDLSFFWENRQIPVLSRIARHIGPMHGLDCGEKIQWIRNYVALAREVTDLRDAYTSPSEQIDTILNAIYDYMNGGSEPVCMHCQAATLAMGSVLHYYGILSRPAAILSTSSHAERTIINSHALLEVYNSDTGRWELHDPTLDLAYGVRGPDGKGQHVSLFEFFCAPEEAFHPICGADHFEVRQRYAFKFSTSERYFTHFRHIVVSRYLSCLATGLLNTDYVDMAHRFESLEHQNIVEFLNTVYRVPTLIAFSQGRMITLPPLKQGFDSDAFRQHNRL